MIKILVLLFIFCFESVFGKLNFLNNNSTLTLTGTDSQLLVSSGVVVNGMINIPNQSSSSIVLTNTNSSLVFGAQGKAVFNGVSYNLTGAFDPLAQHQIWLRGNEILQFAGDFVTKNIVVSGAGNKIVGSAIFQESIELFDANSVLELALFNKLTQNIYLNGGTLRLLQDLNMQDDVEVIGPGEIDFNGFSMNIPYYSRPTSTAPITYKNANDITYSVNTTISSSVAWTGTSNLRGGAGIILTFTSTGVYAIANNAIVYANGVHFKGLGTRSAGNITFGNSSSRLFLSNCAIEIVGNFTQNGGQVIINGSRSQIIADYGDKYIISGATAVFTVDGQVLEYVAINRLPTNPIVTQNGGTISLINGGDIRSSTVQGGTATLSAYLATASGTNFLNMPVDLSDTSSITFVNENAANPKTMLLDGQNTTITFGSKATPTFIVNENITLTVQNITFENFDPTKFSLQGAGDAQAKIVFGDNVILEIADDITLPSSSGFTFTGNTSFLGYSNAASLDISSQGILFSGTSKLLNISGLKVRFNAADAIKMSNSTGTLCLQGCDVVMSSAGIIFDTGNLIIKDLVSISGGNQSTPDAITTFSFTSAGLCTIASASTLRLCHDTKFLYSPNVSGDGGVASVQKRHFKFTNPSSTLCIQNATFDCGSTGVAFDYGRLFIEDSATFVTPFVSGKEFELGSSVTTKVLKSGNLNVAGLIKYVSTTYP